MSSLCIAVISFSFQMHILRGIYGKTYFVIHLALGCKEYYSLLFHCSAWIVHVKLRKSAENKDSKSQEVIVCVASSSVPSSNLCRRVAFNCGAAVPECRGGVQICSQ